MGTLFSVCSHAVICSMLSQNRGVINRALGQGEVNPSM